ncbi:hypothetical protein FKM82_023909 [Ascaphus truei]
MFEVGKTHGRSLLDFAATGSRPSCGCTQSLVNAAMFHQGYRKFMVAILILQTGRSSTVQLLAAILVLPKKTFVKVLGEIIDHFFRLLNLKPTL